MMKFILILLLSLSICRVGKTRNTPAIIDEWIETIPYDNPAKSDSILFWADKLESAAAEIGYQRGINYAQRFRAYYYHFKGDVAKATALYLVFLKSSREINHAKDKLSAISDLVYTYLSLNQNDKAKLLLIETITNAQVVQVDPTQLSSFYNNLGIVYSRDEQIDSAVWAYNKSLILKKEIGDEKGLTNLRVNLSSLYIKLGRYRETIQLSEDNLEFLGDDGNPSHVIHNLINRAAGLVEIGELKEAEKSVQKAVDLANEIGDVSLQQMSTSSMSSFYQKSGQYQKALEYLLKSEEFKSSLFNEQSNIKIAELRETYEADKREQDNRLLSAEVVAQKNRLNFYAVGIIGLVLLLGILLWFWKVNKSKNELLEERNSQIQKQNDKLTDLNTEKNNLMSVVSHDLSTPFSTIKIWAQGLRDDSSKTDVIQTKQTIIQLTDQALSSINRILRIDKEEVVNLELSQLAIKDLFDNIASNHELIAQEKGITIVKNIDPDSLLLLTDAVMLSRVLNNLISNAIKYSHKDGEILLSAEQDTDMIILRIKDHGVGIREEDLNGLFDKYTTGATSPTSGESSHGLGLSIVKRLVDELGGLVSVKSKEGVGSTFTIRIPI